MFENVFRDWNFMRTVRLVLGVMLIIQAYQFQNWGMGMFGGLFIFQGLTNTGCCGSGGACNTHNYKSRNVSDKLSDVEYEEV